MNKKSNKTRLTSPKISAKKAVPRIKKDQSVAKKLPDTFPIVGIGASAGGLEALEAFFKNMPPEPGMAFVVVQHLDPTYKGILAELLQRTTAMPTFQIKDGMAIKPDHIYVIPPNADLSISNGTLHLEKQTTTRGLRLPIDSFFRHLAEDQKEKGIAIILSGMGSDGTSGIKAIKEKMGMAMAQDPKSAKYDAMPQSAIGTGLVDYIAPVEGLPGKLMEYVRHAVKGGPREEIPDDEKTLDALGQIFMLIRNRTGHDFSLYKKNSIIRRIERRMGIHQIEKFSDYLRHLRNTPEEIDLLFKELLIGVTSFFRDPAAFELLKKKYLPALINRIPKGSTIRAWVPGCSTGEEAYSIAIIFQECLEKAKLKGHYKVQIFATDIDSDTVERARRALPRRHCRGGFPKAPGKVLQEAGGWLPDRQRGPGNSALCRSERRHGPALHQARSHKLQESPNLPGGEYSRKGSSRFFTSPSTPRVCCSWGVPRQSAASVISFRPWTGNGGFTRKRKGRFCRTPSAIIHYLSSPRREG